MSREASGKRRQAAAARSCADQGERRLIEWVLEQLRTCPGPRLLLAELASRAGLTPGELSRLFRQRTGQRPAERLRAARLSRAAQLLLLSQLSAKEVAHEAGFRSVSHFVQAFKRTFGATPHRYRRIGER